MKRVGVFASRSPHRPNFLGLSAVRLLGIEDNAEGIVLELGGGDFLDGTPVIDIKPYIQYSDAIPEALGGYGSDESQTFEIVFSPSAHDFCSAYYRVTSRDLKTLIEQVLQQDPRPASQRGKKEAFGCLLWDVNVRWVAQEQVLTVVDCEYVNTLTKE